SRRSLVGSPPCSYAYDRWVRARRSSPGSIGTPNASARSAAAVGRLTATGSVQLDDLAAVVGAAHLAGGVGHLRRPAPGARHGQHAGGLPLCPPRTGVAARHPALRYGHGVLPRSRVSQQFPQRRPTGVELLLVAVVRRQVIPV